ncbi:MAG: HAMP domain-containing sensor histidine kinase [Kiritimatiellia bacterium]|nr:HAMP domain-containing sensor histidine kinase [Kiritimatiellia bacterium]MDP6847414.1 HAMP domain-containing sensor histidine kinase [Kiritimatiellia bacterium]
MKPKLFVVFLVIVLLPLSLLIWTGVRLARDEQGRLGRRITEALEGRLSEINDGIARLVAGHETSLLKATDPDSLDAEFLRSVMRQNRLTRQLFVIDSEHRLIYPEAASTNSLTSGERDFLERTRSVWVSGETFYHQHDTGTRSSNRYGWHTWFWEQGLSFIFWQRLDSGQVVGAEVDRIAVMADIVASLPSGTRGSRLLDGRISLVDTSGKPLYQWGEHEPATGVPPAAEVPLCQPYSSWRLQYFVAPHVLQANLGRSTSFNVLSGLAVMAIALIGLTIYFYRESARESREAVQRVSFVNQVSHELKTPLTNIRMYAELLEKRISEKDDKAKRQARIVAGESQRLSRLITNVLTFAKGQRNGLSYKPAPGIPDACVTSVLSGFQQAFRTGHIDVGFSRGAGNEVLFDADLLEQVLGNLFSNVEKYASGGELHVCSSQDGDSTTISVKDSGPGIPRGQRKRIFKPFERLSNKVTDGVSGTGIGLSIARDLARLHGGDLALKDSNRGAHFILTLHTPLA